MASLRSFADRIQYYAYSFVDGVKETARHTYKSARTNVLSLPIAALMAVGSMTPSFARGGGGGGGHGGGGGFHGGGGGSYSMSGGSFRSAPAGFSGHSYNSVRMAAPMGHSAQAQMRSQNAGHFSSGSGASMRSGRQVAQQGRTGAAPVNQQASQAYASWKGENRTRYAGNNTRQPTTGPAAEARAARVNEQAVVGAQKHFLNTTSGIPGSTLSGNTATGSGRTHTAANGATGPAANARAARVNEQAVVGAQKHFLNTTSGIAGSTLSGNAASSSGRTHMAANGTTGAATGRAGAATGRGQPNDLAAAGRAQERIATQANQRQVMGDQAYAYATTSRPGSFASTSFGRGLGYFGFGSIPLVGGYLGYQYGASALRPIAVAGVPAAGVPAPNADPSAARDPGAARDPAAATPAPAAIPTPAPVTLATTYTADDATWWARLAAILAALAVGLGFASLFKNRRKEVLPIAPVPVEKAEPPKPAEKDLGEPKPDPKPVPGEQPPQDKIEKNDDETISPGKKTFMGTAGIDRGDGSRVHKDLSTDRTANKDGGNKDEPPGLSDEQIAERKAALKQAQEFANDNAGPEKAAGDNFKKAGSEVAQTDKDAPETAPGNDDIMKALAELQAKMDEVLQKLEDLDQRVTKLEIKTGLRKKPKPVKPELTRDERIDQMIGQFGKVAKAVTKLDKRVGALESAPSKARHAAASKKSSAVRSAKAGKKAAKKSAPKRPAKKTAKKVARRHAAG